TKCAIAIVAKEHVAFIGKVSDNDVGKTIVIVIAEVHAHAGEGLSVFVVSHSGKQARLAKRTVSVVVIKKALHRIVGHEDIRNPVPAVISKCHPKALAMRIRDSGFLGNIRKRSVSIVVIENVGHTFVIVRMAVSTISRPLLSAKAVGFEAPVHITCDEEIELAVVVVIEEPCAGAPAACTDSGFSGHVSKRSVSIVVIQGVSSIPCYIDIFETIVVVVSDSDTHAIEALRSTAHARTYGHIGERSIRILMVETIPILPIRLVREFTLRHRVF